MWFSQFFFIFVHLEVFGNYDNSMPNMILNGPNFMSLHQTLFSLLKCDWWKAKWMPSLRYAKFNDTRTSFMNIFDCDIICGSTICILKSFFFYRAHAASPTHAAQRTTSSFNWLKLCLFLVVVDVFFCTALYGVWHFEATSATEMKHARERVIILRWIGEACAHDETSVNKQQ